MVAVVDRLGLHVVPIALATARLPEKLVEKKAPEVPRVRVTFEPAAKPEPAGEVNVKVRVLPVEPAVTDVGLTAIVPDPFVAGLATISVPVPMTVESATARTVKL